MTQTFASSYRITDLVTSPSIKIAKNNEHNYVPKIKKTVSTTVLTLYGYHGS